MWFGERLNRRLKTRNPKYALCCMQGQMQLPLLKEPPEFLMNLLNGDDKLSKHFQRNTNMVFSITSLGGKVDRSVRKVKSMSKIEDLERKPQDRYEELQLKMDLNFTKLFELIVKKDSKAVEVSEPSPPPYRHPNHQVHHLNLEPGRSSRS